MKKFSMKAKTIQRIADQIAKSKSGYNEEGGTYSPSPKDFARLTWFLEKVMLPHHIEQYTQKELEKYITQYLVNKGHEIEQEYDDELSAQENPEIYTIHSTKEEKQKEKEMTWKLLNGQMPCPNCGAQTLKPNDPDHPQYPLVFQCQNCGQDFARKQLINQDLEKETSFENIFYPA